MAAAVQQAWSACTHHETVLFYYSLLTIDGDMTKRLALLCLAQLLKGTKTAGNYCTTGVLLKCKYVTQVGTSLSSKYLTTPSFLTSWVPLMLTVMVTATWATCRSCLAYHRMTNSFRHYDSSPGAGNRSVARELAGAAAPLVRSRHQPSGTRLQQSTFVQVASMPTQQNGHDCGLYVCAVAQRLCALLEEWRALPANQQQQDSTTGCAGCTAHCSSSNLRSCPPVAGSSNNFGDCSPAAGSSETHPPAAGSSEAQCHAFESQEQKALQAITGSYVAAFRQEMLQVIQQLASQSNS